MTDDELDTIERDFRGVSEQREEFCTMCGEGWELWKKEPVQYPGGPGPYILHFHIPPWEYAYSNPQDHSWPDPRPEVRVLLEEIRRLKGILAEDGL